MKRCLSLLLCAVLALLLASIPVLVTAAPAERAVAAQHAARAKHLYDDGFYRLLPRHNRAEAEAKFDLAVRENLRAIELDPDSEVAYRQLAQVYRAQKRFDDVIDAYQQVLRLNPADVDLRVRLADVLTLRHRYHEALDQLLAARTYTDDPDALAQIDRFIGMLDEAL
jgi:tetratricopeptide (TPR) repeat protein